MLNHRRSNSDGQLGTGDQQNRATPTPIAGEHSHFALISAGSQHTCGVLADSRKVACWGERALLLAGMWQMGCAQTSVLRNLCLNLPDENAHLAHLVTSPSALPAQTVVLGLPPLTRQERRTPVGQRRNAVPGHASADC